MTTSDAGHVPLRPVEFQILLSLSKKERHGYAILQDAESRTGGEVAPGLATLYRALRRMEDQGLVEESERASGPDDDERRRYYRITEEGRSLARAEARRLEMLVQAAADADLLGGERA